MLRVIEYFAKSLKVIRNDTLEYGVSPCLVFRCLYLVRALTWRHHLVGSQP